jgi:hypothetical protein
MGRSAPTAAAETPAGRLPDRTTGPVVVVAAPVVVGPVVVVAGPVEVVVGAALVVGPVVGAMLVVDTSVVIDATVLVSAVVVGSAVGGGAVTMGWVVTATVEGAVVGVLPPTVAGAWAGADRAVVVGPLTARRPGFAVVDSGGAVVGSRGAVVVVVVVVVVVDTDVGAGLVGNVDSAIPGTRRGGSGWGSRVAEATTAARAAVVSAKTNSSSLQGRRGVARCRGGGVGMVRHPGLTCTSCLKGVRGSRTLTGHKGPSSA